jgi:hypothetical protein
LRIYGKLAEALPGYDPKLKTSSLCNTPITRPEMKTACSRLKHTSEGGKRCVWGNVGIVISRRKQKKL